MSREEILKKVASGEMTAQEGSAMLDSASAPAGGNLYCKIGAKGGVSVYGMGRFPLTLYVEQWDRLLAFADEIREFIAQQNGALKRRPPSAAIESARYHEYAAAVAAARLTPRSLEEWLTTYREHQRQHNGFKVSV